MSLSSLFLATILVGCGGLGEDGEGNDAATEQTGYFVDSPVEGFTYFTDTFSGQTLADGRFRYMAGESETSG
jgi:hypothetical protein